MSARSVGLRPATVYESALRSSEPTLWATGRRGRRRLPVATWLGAPAPADELILVRCTGPTLDVGCGPGRLTAGLAARGVPALGIDVAPFAVALARRTGASALCRDVFGPLPGEGRWREVLLIDGNIGIGGQPRRLLARVARLLAPGGSVLVELDPPGTPSGAYWTRLEAGGMVSAPFRWAGVSVNGMGPLAATANLRVGETWQCSGRHFGRLVSTAGRWT
ncbi:class I SAM-dependent methyltransferase [Frankia sp. Cas3]|uniref:class I SAM-dependent methyltransferase n=1 Tax=Frankia sp. Cas3 TaxID=3073926 RepID=UPI002AD593AE|nr:class I SAM-dependent methyltransferase [Frankia sp. Cas3]